MNPYIYNPAYAGVEGHTTFFVTYRDQWTNIETAPTLADFSFHVPLKGGIAVGGAAFNTSFGPLQTSAAKISGAYLINIDKTHFLRVGMSLGYGLNSLDFNVLADIDPNDRAFDGFLDQSSFALGDFGMTYHFGHFNVGFAIPNLFSYSPITQTEFNTPEFSPTDNVLFKMNYRGHISDNFAIEPHLIYRYSNVIPHQYEAVLIAHLYHIVWVGASYRQNSNIIGLVGTKINEKFGLGFSYELGNSSISSQLGPTLEVTLGYHLGTKKAHAEHVSSFIKSHRLSAEERAKQAELERQKRLASLQESRTEETTAQVEDEDQLGIVESGGSSNSNVSSSSNSTLANPESDTPQNIPTEIVDTWDHNEEHPELVRTNQFGEEERGIRLEKPNPGSEEKNVVISWVPTEEAKDLTVADEGHLERELPDGSKEIGIKYEKANEDGSTEHVIKWDRAIDQSQAEVIKENPALTEQQQEQVAKSDPELTQDFRTHEELATSDDHVVVKRGSHILELPAGNFVIAGAFNEFQHAEDYSDDLFESGFQDVIVGFSSARGYYYVVVYRSGNIEQARARRDVFRGTSQLQNAWVLQVTD